MRVIVPLQGVVQGRGGLVLGSVIPCALFYFFQLYLKQRQRRKSPPPPPEISPRLNRVLSRSILSPRGSSGPAHVSLRANSIVKVVDSAYFVGLNRVSEDPFHEFQNPDGVFQLGLTENMLCKDLVEKWLSDNGQSICEIAADLPNDGLMELKGAVIGEEKVTSAAHILEANLQIFPPNNNGGGRQGYQTMAGPSALF